MEKINYISFDMEGTLIDHTYSRIIWENDIPRIFAEKHKVSLNEAKKRVSKAYASIGEMQPEWYDIEYWFNRFNLNQDWRSLLRDRKNHVKVYKEVRKTLKELERKFVLIVSSNTIKDFLIVEIEVLGNFFEYVFSAPSDFQIVKKDKKFYNKILNIIRIKPEQMLHVGDHYNFDYIAPKKVGIQSYFLERSGEKKGPEIIHSLEELLNLVDS